MTRIIQRCFLILAFTGVLLSSAEDTALSGASNTTSQLNETSSSSLANSSVWVESSTFNSSESKKTEERSNSSAWLSTESPEETWSENIQGKNASTSSSKNKAENVSDNSVDSTSVASESNKSGQHQLQNSTFVPNASNPEGLLKAELLNAESRGTEISPEKSSESSAIGKSKDDSVEKGENVSDSNTTIGKEDSLSGGFERTSMASMAYTNGDEGEITQVDAFNSTDVNLFKTATKDFRNSVPSKEKTIYNSSYVDEKESPEETFNTETSNTDENEINETAKSETRKRSLNATNTLSREKMEMFSELSSSSMPVVTFLSTTLTPSKTEEGTILDEAMTTAHTSSGENNEDVIFTTKDYPEIETTSFPPHLTDGDVHDTETKSDFGADNFHESEYLEAELAPVRYEKYVHISPESSAALSTLRKESLHLVESTDDTAQIPNETRKTSTSFPNSQKSPNQEMTSAASINRSEFLVTFDPDGMTHNFSQEPDSVTFSPGVFHVGGMPSDEYFSRLESDEFSFENITEIIPSVAKITEVVTQDPKEIFPEREREMGIPNPDLFPHDEPDIDVVSAGNVDISTKHPAAPNHLSTINPISLSSVVTSESKIALPSNDESEEMLNDSPHFDHFQTKSTAVPATQLKNISVDKNLEMQVNNDIAHLASFSTRYTPETANELEFSTEYQTEQSEIRPVTAVSPLKTSESQTVLPVLPKVVSNSLPKSASSREPERVTPHTSSPIILSNLAPSVLNQSAETTIGVLQSGTTAQNNESDLISKSGDGTASPIAGVAVRTSVSVSFPLLNIQNGTENLTVHQNEKYLESNISGAILPVPIIKDTDGHPALTVVSTHLSSTDVPMPSTTTSSGFRILKPFPRKPNGDSTNGPSTPRTRKPFLQPPQKSSTTEGPSVPSIFKKARTRIASITSSTTARPLRPFSTIRIHYSSRLPGMLPDGELVISTEPITTTIATTTDTEEPFSDEPFTEQTQSPIFSSEDNVTLLKVAGYIVMTKGLRWSTQLNERRSPLYKERADFVQKQLYRLFRTSPIAFHLWKIEIDGFSIKGSVNNVAVDFFLYLVKTENDFSMEQLTSVFHDKLKNNTFSRFTVDTNETAFQYVSDELMHSTTEPPEKEPEPVLPQWAIAVIVVGAASLIFIVLFAAVAILGRHHVRRRYSSKLNDEDSERPGDWEGKMAAAYENLAADTIYDVEDMHTDTYKKRHPNITNPGRASQPRRADSWSSSDWSPPPRRLRPQVHRIVV